MYIYAKSKKLVITAELPLPSILKNERKFIETLIIGKWQLNSKF